MPTDTHPLVTTPLLPAPPPARWAKFASISVPWLTKLANVFLSGQFEARQVELASDAVDNLEKLGPTFLKLAQILSIRCSRRCSLVALQLAAPVAV